MRLSVIWFLVALVLVASALLYHRGTEINRLNQIIETPAESVLLKLPNGDVCVGVKVNGKEWLACHKGVCSVRT